MSSANGQEKPRWSREAEQALLGSMLRANEIIDEVYGIVRPEAFYMAAHQEIDCTIIRLHERGDPVDTITVAEALNQAGRIDDVGGHKYLGQLQDAGFAPSNAEYHARIIRDYARLRELIAFHQRRLRAAEDYIAPVDDLIESDQQELFAISEGTIDSEIVDAPALVRCGYDRQDERIRRGDEPLGIQSGLTDLDDRTGGFQDSELIVIGARPSHGKTSLGLQIAQNAFLQGLSVFFASLEQGRGEVIDRLFASQGRINLRSIRKGIRNPEERARLLEVGGKISDSSFWTYDQPNLRMSKLAPMCRRLKSKQKIDLAVIDYLQLIESDDRRADRHEQVAGISRRFKALTRELKIPVIVMSQLNRECEKRPGREPYLSDLRDSGGIEQDADVVMLMWCPGEGDKEPEEIAEIEVKIAKQRNGPTGRVPLIFRKPWLRFENWSPGIPE